MSRARSSPGYAHAAARFEEAGVPFTVQRRAVWESLARRKDHPTADDVFESVEERMPGVSRTTVYRSLETLVQWYRRLGEERERLRGEAR